MSDSPLIDSLAAAVAVRPDDLPLRLHLAETLLAAGRSGEAIRRYLISMTWPVRRLLAGLRRWFPATVALVVALTLVSIWWDTADLIGRILAALFAAVVLGFAARVLIPAGRTPWRCLRLVPRLVRRATAGGLLTVGVMVALLIGYAATGWWILPVVALLAGPVLWFCGFAESLGARLDAPGFRYALRDLGSRFRNFGGELRDWWRATKKELREVWTEPSTADESDRR
jgi:hypothetical protein